MTLDDRILIASMLDQRLSFKEIGNAIGKDCTTISREIRSHLVFKKTGAFGKPFNACFYRASCQLHHLCDDCNLYQGRTRCSFCKYCNDHCDHFREEKCRLLDKAPYVCNGCVKRKSCALEKRFYLAKNAYDEYRTILSETRQGISLTPEEVSYLDRLFSPLIMKGQSVHHIFVNNYDAIMVCENTIYRLIDYNLFEARNIDLPRKVRFSSRKVKKHVKLDKACRKGRTYQDFLAFMEQHPDLPVTEMDSVEGKRGGKVLLTIHFVKAELMIAFLRDSNDARSVLDSFDRLYKALGREAFSRVMPVLLGDNGSEFSDPSRIESSQHGVPRTKVFYCDPSAPEQKGSAERNHELIRYCIPKGTSMDFLTQEMVDHMMDNINSLTRKSLGDKCPYDAFSYFYGREVLDLLGCKKIPANDVILKPSLFDRFIKEADISTSGSLEEAGVQGLAPDEP